MSDGRQISIVGWSLGGIYARQIARQAPDWVRLVVTLGSPFRRVPGEESTAAPAMRAMAARGRLSRPSWPAGDAPLPVPSTSIFSSIDGIVPWRACLDTIGGPHETLEVTGSHCGLGHHPAALWAIADRLAQPAARWEPMDIPSTLRPLLAPTPAPEPATATRAAPAAGGDAGRPRIRRRARRCCSRAVPAGAVPAGAPSRWERRARGSRQAGARLRCSGG